MTLPGLTVEVALNTGPNDDPTGDWTDLSDRVLAFDMNRGREDRTAVFEPGTVSILLDNSDDQLDPLAPGSLVELAADKGLPLCPIRVQGPWEGVDYPLFYGFIGPECWIVERNRVDAGSAVRLEAVDRMGLFAQTGLPSSLYAAQVQWLQPSWWVRGIGGDVAAGNGDALRDSSGNGVVGEIAASGSDVIFETASLVEGESDSAMLHQAGVSGFTDDATLIAARANMTMACVWKGDPDAADQEIMRQRNMTSTHVRWRVECQVGGAIVAIIYDTSGTPTDFVAAPANPSSGGRWDDGEPHLIFCRVEGGTRMRIWVDGQRDECVASIPATIAGRVIFGGGSQNATFDEVAYWDSALPTLDINSITDAFMGVAPFAGDTFADRLDRWLALAGASAGSIDVIAGSTPDTLHGVTTMPATLAEAFTATTESFRGNWLALRTGDIRARDIEAANHAISDDYYRDPRVSLVDRNFTTAPDIDGYNLRISRSRPEFYGTRLDRVVNMSRVTWQGLAFSMRNDASIARYGERIRDWTSEREAALDAVLLADDEVNGTNTYAVPSLDVKPVTIWPLIDEGAGYFAFRLCELERGIGLEWTAANGDRYSTDLNVQSESWSWADGGDLTVELTVAASLGAPVLSVRAAAGSESFAYTGAAQSFTVPLGITSVAVVADGASGGGYGGLGARVVTTLDVTPGETLQVNVGGAGSLRGGSSPYGAGWNGGGRGGYGSTANGHGGGGASDVRQGGTALADRAVVAAGGGGGAWIGSGSGPDHAGGDGGTVGDAGLSTVLPARAGQGGTGSAGGAGGTGAGGDGDAGALGQGGNSNGADTHGGGGGGGGKYGGGGGTSTGSSSSSGGGGGSSASTGYGTTITDGANTGNGSVTITWS